MNEKIPARDLLQKKVAVSLIDFQIKKCKQLKEQSALIERIDCIREMLETCSSKLLLSVQEITPKHKRDLEYIARSLVFYKEALWEIRNFYESKAKNEIEALTKVKFDTEKEVKKIEKTKERKK